MGRLRNRVITDRVLHVATLRSVWVLPAMIGLLLFRLAARRSYRIAGVTEWARERTPPATRRAWIYPALLVSAKIAVGCVLAIATR